MPRVEILPQPELDAIFGERREFVDLSDAIAILGTRNPAGRPNYIEVVGVSERLVKRRVNQTARKLGITIDWLPTPNAYKGKGLFYTETTRAPDAAPKAVRRRRTIKDDGVK